MADVQNMNLALAHSKKYSAFVLAPAMENFPEFMKRPANRIARTDQATPGVEGFVFDGADGSHDCT